MYVYFDMPLYIYIYLSLSFSPCCCPLFFFRFVIYERALRSLPGSYKLWRRYLLERVALCNTSGGPSGAPLYVATNAAFERCLVHLSRMPEIWRLYLKFLQQQKQLTRCRRTFDAALRALAVTQHEVLWPDMMEYVKVTSFVLLLFLLLSLLLMWLSMGVLLLLLVVVAAAAATSS